MTEVAQADPTTQRLFEDKLAESGLTLNDASKLGMRPLTPDETASLATTFKAQSAMRLDYFMPDGSPLRDIPGADPYYRIRYLGKPASSGFDKTAKKSSGPKYMQPSGTLPAIYYPQNYDGWVDLCTDPNKPIVITEGELKAAKACREGFPCIGIGGVHSWRALKRGVTWLASLECMSFARRQVYLCFDSDYRENKQVCKALAQFAEALEQRGAFVEIVQLPDLEGVEKTGLDDFLVYHGDRGGEHFEQLLDFAVPLGLTRPLFEMNDRYAYVSNPGMIVSLHDYSDRFKPEALKAHREATKSYMQPTMNAEGEISFKPVSAAATWLTWPLRNEVSAITYVPGAEQYVDGKLNTWGGWGCEPVEGDVSMFLQLVEHLFTGSDPGALEWFLRWCAYPIQHPGTKLFSACLLQGERQGTGKSLIGYSLSEIYGENFIEIGQDDLQSQYNSWAERKQLVMGDDVTGSSKREYADRLKKLITQKSVRINEKYLPAYVVPDCVNYLFTSNHPDALYLEKHDRRFFVHGITVGPLGSPFYAAYEEWLFRRQGGQALRYWLENLDLGDFNPSAPAFRTTAREVMITYGMSSLRMWTAQLAEAPESILNPPHAEGPEEDMFSAEELVRLYDPTERSGVTSNGMGKALQAEGVPKANGSKKVRTADGATRHYYIVRNTEKWESATHAEIAEYINQAKGLKSRKGG